MTQTTMRTGTRSGTRRGAALGVLLRAASVLGLAEAEVRGLRGVVRPGDVCFDIGAAYGMYAHSLAALVGPTGAVHAFEPLPLPGRLLGVGARLGGGPIVPVAAAMGEVELADQEFRLPVRFGLPIHGWSHVGGRDVRVDGPQRVLRVPVHTVDAYCASADVDRVDFMKIDVEGFEPAVLAGAAGTIAEHRPALQLEIEQRHLDRYGHRAEDLVAGLRAAGYRMHGWARGTWSPVEQVTAHRRNYLFTGR